MTPIMLLACAGDLPEASWNGHEPVTTETGDVYAAEVLPIWETHCLRCHDSTHSALDLDGGPEGLIGVPAAAWPDLSLVEPASTGESFLWLKLMGRQTELGEGTGEAMPLGEGPLEDTDLATLEAWILGL